MLGVNVVEIYGQTETAGGIICGQRGPFPRPGDVGTVPAGWEVKLADDGEMLVQKPGPVRVAIGTTTDATRAVKARTAGCVPAISGMARRRASPRSTAPATSS